MIGLFIFLITFVVPRFAQLYDQLGTKLPSLTLLLLALGNDVQHYGSICAAGARAHRLPHRALDPGLTPAPTSSTASASALPVFGQVWLKYQVALFSRTLSTLLTGGLPLVPSLETAARSIDRASLPRPSTASVESVREGQGLATSLEETSVFPELSVEMIEVGESTGALPPMLNSVAEFFEEDVQTPLTASWPYRARDPDRHGRCRRHHSDRALYADL